MWYYLQKRSEGRWENVPRWRVDKLESAVHVVNFWKPYFEYRVVDHKGRPVYEQESVSWKETGF